MSNSVRPYEAATLVDAVHATADDGSPVAIEWFQGQASDGHHSGYQHRPVQWLLFTWGAEPNVRRHGMRYAGRRLPQAARDFAAAKAEVDQHEQARRQTA